MKLQHYSQLYLRKIPQYLIDWRLFVFNSVIYVWGGFKNNALKDILLSYIFCNGIAFVKVTKMMMKTNFAYILLLCTQTLYFNPMFIAKFLHRFFKPGSKKSQNSEIFHSNFIQKPTFICLYLTLIWRASIGLNVNISTNQSVENTISLPSFYIFTSSAVQWRD